MFDELLQILISAAASAQWRQEKKRSGGGDEADEDAMIDGGHEEEMRQMKMPDEEDRLDAELCCGRRRWLRSGARRWFLLFLTPFFCSGFYNLQRVFFISPCLDEAVTADADELTGDGAGMRQRDGPAGGTGWEFGAGLASLAG
ncbi:hypothetical protein SLEP1_g40375 [Rubroshorea leprosula]|uniref:Uncharacterized protein n=1 Tax=Rubroshorea leprosula TaxID=152421 RepID=A0AAV5L429_9ROSI|nr:hypothetical protein SLEP1_g40375 [Rubroshorea leprosula]